MNTKLLPALLLVVLFVACGPDHAVFTEPMPPDEKSLTAIPKRYRGDYVSKDGSEYLHIKKEMIVQEYDYDVRIHRDSLTYWDSLAGDTLWDKYHGGYRTVSIDSSGYLSYHVNYEKIMFAIWPTTGVAKKFKGRLFLNYTYCDSLWTVEQVQLKKGVLTINDISSAEEFEALNEAVENDSDTIAASYSPTKKQFKQFVQADGFRYGEEYYRVK